MGKRKHRDEDKQTEKIKKKLRKLEKMLERQEKERNKMPEIEDHTPPGSPVTSARHTDIEERELQECTGDNIPEELLGALGKEGELIEEKGEPLLPQLVKRWTNIMNDGLGKEARENLLKKYPNPENFTASVPPIMNPEILAALSEPSLKRDQRIVVRQRLLGKMMASLGKTLSNILKGNLNSKEIVEHISDSAKIAAEVFYQDSVSRKFFALAGATNVVKKAVKQAKTDEYLFGKECGEKIKAAQAIQRTGSQIKITDKTEKKQPKKGNWKGPLQPQQRPRSGQYQQQNRGRQPARRRPQKTSYQQRHPRRY